MAIIEPPLDQIDPGFHRGEYDTLEWLQSALPDEIKIFHSVEWLKNRKYKTTIGEVDFCILGPSGALIETQQRHYKFYDAGVCRTLSSLSFSPDHLLIEGPAGSGKTQIAMELFSSYLLKNKRPLYLCFNRPLAESVRTAIPEGGFVCNIDRFTDLYMKERAIMSAQLGMD